MGQRSQPFARRGRVKGAVELSVVCVNLIIVVLMMADQSYGEIDPGTAVGVWLLDDEDETAEDFSGNGRNGKITGAESVDGKFGKALDFNGVDDSVEVLDSEEGLDGIPEITVTAWIKYDQSPPQNYSPVGKESDYRFIIGQGGNGHFVLATANNAWYSAGTVASGGGMTTGEWHHLAGAYDGKLVQFYVDGELAGKGPQEVSGDVNNGAGSFHIAKTIAGNVEYFEGIVDEIAVFNVALTEADIKVIMTNGLEKAVTGDIAVSPAGSLNSIWAAIKSSGLGTTETRRH